MKKIGMIGSKHIKHIGSILSSEYEISYIQDVYTISNKFKRYFMLFKEIGKIDILYNEYSGEILWLYILLCKIRRKKIITHWIGTDVLNYKNTWFNRKFFNSINIHLCNDLNLKKELKDLQISAETLTIIPNTMDLSLPSMPDEHAVLVYLPKGKEKFYGYDTVKQLSNIYTNINFYIVANDDKTLFTENNVKVLGYLSFDEMAVLYKDISIILRITYHDSISQMIIEGMYKGKEVIWNWDHPLIHVCKSFDDVNNTMKSIVCAQPKINEVEIKYAKEHYNSKNFLENFKRIIKDL